MVTDGKRILIADDSALVAATKLQIDTRGLVLHVFLQTEFCHALLRIEIGGVLADNLLVDVEGFFGLAFLEVVFPEGQIILDGAAQQAPLGVQIAQEPVHVVAGRIELQDFLVGGDGLERGALGPKGICGLNE